VNDLDHIAPASGVLPPEDFFELHFGDGASEEIGTAAELLQATGFKWFQRTYSSDVLGTVTLLDTVEADDEEPLPDIVPGPNNQQDFGVRTPGMPRRR